MGAFCRGRKLSNSIKLAVAGRPNAAGLRESQGISPVDPVTIWQRRGCKYLNSLNTEQSWQKGFKHIQSARARRVNIESFVGEIFGAENEWSPVTLWRAAISAVFLPEQILAWISNSSSDVLKCNFTVLSLDYSINSLLKDGNQDEQRRYILETPLYLSNLCKECNRVRQKLSSEVNDKFRRIMTVEVSTLLEEFFKINGGFAGVWKFVNFIIKKKLLKELSTRICSVSTLSNIERNMTE